MAAARAFLAGNTCSSRSARVLVAEALDASPSPIPSASPGRRWLGPARGFRPDGVRGEGPGDCLDRDTELTVLFPAKGDCAPGHTAPIIEGPSEGNAGSDRRREKPGSGSNRTRAATQHFYSLKWPTADFPTKKRPTIFYRRPLKFWSGRGDLNTRHPAPKAKM